MDFIKLFQSRILFIFFILCLHCITILAQNEKQSDDTKQKILDNYHRSLKILAEAKTDSLIRISKNLLDLYFQDSLKSMNNGALKKALEVNKNTPSITASTLRLTLNSELELFEESLVENFYYCIEKQDSLNATIPNLELGWQFNSLITYRGRIFGAGDIGNNIWCNFHLPIGLTFIVNGYYWPGATRKWAKTDIGIEYEKQISKNFSATVGYERWFINDPDKASRTDINNFIELYLSYDFNYFSLNSGTYYMFGTAKSWQSDLEISSYFEWYNKLGADKIFIEPSYKATWGTQFVSLGYYSTNPKINNNFFGIMAHELSTKITYQLKSFQFAPAIYYIHPVNGTQEDPVKDFFYFSAALYYKIRIKK